MSMLLVSYPRKGPAVPWPYRKVRKVRTVLKDRRIPLEVFTLRLQNLPEECFFFYRIMDESREVAENGHAS